VRVVSTFGSSGKIPPCDVVIYSTESISMMQTANTLLVGAVIDLHSFVMILWLLSVSYVLLLLFDNEVLLLENEI